jgi:hypothetical protein
VAHPIPPQAPAAAASSRGAHRGGEGWKAPLRRSTPDESEDEIVEEESDEDVDVYLNTDHGKKMLKYKTKFSKL